ncbi:MAG: glycosyltransferase family 2 protein [Acidimicrobiales bacterium]
MPGDADGGVLPREQVGPPGAVAVLPTPPSDSERVTYVCRHLGVLGSLVFFAFAGITYGFVRLALSVGWAEVFLVYWCFAMLSFAVSLVANYFTRDFDIDRHDRFVDSHLIGRCPSIDVWLPNCGESLEILRNTWAHVAGLQWPGTLNVYCLDDRGLPEVERLAQEFGFHYLSRPDKGWMKKSGNLKFAYENSAGELVALFDADFCPRPDMLFEILPYFQRDPGLAIVQTSQFFRVSKLQNWIERGAAQAQEYFYRACQWSRQQRGAAICCGTNAVYRRAALDENGGMTLIPQGEDMRTGFDLQQLGWGLLYLPLNLATGLCPDNISSYFKQQYRWCMGSLRLLGEESFWQADLSLKTRLCYVAGFNYYVQTALYTFMIPALMISLLVFEPQRFQVRNYVVFLPALLVLLVAYPLWHRCRYGTEAWSIRIVCEWCYIFAIVDFLHDKVIPWDATGSRTASVAASSRFRQFKWLALSWNGATAACWAGLAIFRMVTLDWVSFVVISVMGVFYLSNSCRLVRTFQRQELLA